MASSESNTFEESTLTTTTRENMSTENRPTQTQNDIEMDGVETQKEISSHDVNLNPATATQRSAAYRGLRLTDTNDEQQADDSWWNEIENNELLLDHVPNVTAVFTPTPEAILEKSISLAESEKVLKEENFDRLHKIADKIKMTLSEHAKNKEKEEETERERKLSETSDKENKTGYCETDYSSSGGGGGGGTLIAHKEQSLEEFKEELRTKRLERQNAVQDLREELNTLRRQLALEREANRRLRRGEHVEESSFLTSTLDSGISLEEARGIDLTDDEDPLRRSRHANIELANAQLALQMATSENISLRGELAVVQKQVCTLKEVIACCKQMLAVKEEQCNELKRRLTEIEKSFAEHETKIMSDNLRQEYERQLVNIRQLRQLYEERQRVAAAEYENLQRLISIKRDELAQEQEKSKSLEERNQNLLKEIETANNELACLRDECKEHKFEKAVLKEEMGAVNTLFSQMVMGFNGKNNLDIDRLTTMLEENRTLLNDMATKECTDGATLPKLLFELVEQATTSTHDGKKKITTPLQLSRSPSPGNEAVTTKQVVKQQADEVEENDEESVTEYENDNDNENENMAELTATVKQLQQDELPTEEAPSSSCNHDSTSPARVDTLTKSHANEDVDATTNNTEGSVIVTTQNKNKKHHRKPATNNKKSSSSSSSTASGHTSSVAATTMQHLHDDEVISSVTSAQEIVGNLPKVWRVLMELLSHHKIDPVQFEENGKSEDCYKSVETPNGPKAELSVSKTYIKLKDLILEKKSLVKETNRLKTLNSHLDYRLNEQEKRLSAVSLELTKTWHLVGKMQRQHRQLHTQEQILRYQLQQKRRLLSELKDELEYCRRKWAAARAKNDESQEQCNDLRREFARRKLEDANNSAESGYSDSGGPASDEDVAVPEDGAEGGEVLRNVNDGHDDLDDGILAASTSAAGGCVNYRRKRLREMFEHTRKIKRMQSTSPGRAGNVLQTEMVVLRWNSAPPTCGWRDSVGVEENFIDDDVDGTTNDNSASSSNHSSERGAIPKAPTRPSRRTKLRITEKPESDDKKPVIKNEKAASPEERTCRIQRLEEQCKTLIKQVLETSDNRERLEVQLKRFQDEMSPAQHAVPLEEIIKKKRFERMTRASSVPLTFSGCLTPREEEYTRKRSERLERLEEESRQLMSRIKRTSDRGHYLRCSLDRIRRAPLSREGSIESNTEDDSAKKPAEEEENISSTESNSQDNSQSENVVAQPTVSKVNPLTAEEEAYTARRAERLLKLEEESKQLLTQLSRNNQRGDNIGNRLDTLHERYKTQEDASASGSHKTYTSPAQTASIASKMSVEQRIENIEKISSNREERLRILEEEGRQLINKLSETSERGSKMINRIAERELNRQKRSSCTPIRDTSLDKNASTSVKVVNHNSTSEETPAAAALLPTPKNVACSSIVSEELNDRVTITTIPSQIAANQGAIPKSKPTLQLLASRPKSARIQKTKNNNLDNANETLEDMVKRLQSLPFPGEESTIKQQESEPNDLEVTSIKPDIDVFETIAEVDKAQDQLIPPPVAVEDEAAVIQISEETNLQQSSTEKD